MEALASLSLAGTIVQIVDFTSKLVFKAIEIRKSSNGLDQASSDITLVAKTLARLSHELETSSNANLPKEREMNDLAAQCKDVAEKLMAVIAKFKNSGKHTTRSSFLQAMRFVMSKDEIAELTRRMESICRAMNICLLKMIS